MQQVCIKCKCIKNDDDFDYNKLNQRYKTCIKCRQQRLNKDVDDTQQCCTRCYTVKPKTEYGTYKGVFSEIEIPYTKCNTCRDSFLTTIKF